MTKETERYAEPRETAKRKPPYQPGHRFEFKQYQKVICNGYPGTVQQVHQGKLKGMVDVRVPGGLVCVSSSYPDCYPEPELSAWTVLYGEDHLIFECQAEDISHAIEQCENAYPGEVIVSAAMTALKSVAVTQWNSRHYGGAEPMGDFYLMEITDKRKDNGQLFIDVAPEQGNIDDVMIASFEINALPDDNKPTQALHLHFDGDNLAMTAFKRGNSYILRPETDVKITTTVLPNGEQAYILE